MSVGSGLSTQVMIGEEATVGTAVTPSRGYEVHSVTPTHNTITAVSSGLRAASLGHRARNRAKVGVDAQLTVPTTVFSQDAGLWLKHALGSATATQIDTSDTYRQIHLPDDLTGLGLTVQVGLAQTDGTVRPYTYRGCKITSWELACQMDQLLEATWTLDAWAWDTSTSLVAASYTDNDTLEEYHWGLLSATIGGTVATASGRTTITSGTALSGLRGIDLKGTNTLRTNRRLAGGSGVKSEQLENDFRSYTGDLDLEFADRTQVLDLADDNTSTALQFVFTGVNKDDDSNAPTLRITYPAVKFESAAPSAGGPDMVDGKASFTAYEDDSGDHPLIQIEYESIDSTP